MHRRQWVRWCGFGALVVTLGACTATSPTATDANTNPVSNPASPLSESPQATASPTESPPSSPPRSPQASLQPGVFCFAAKTATVTANLQLELTTTGAVYGKSQATIQDQAASYYSSYEQIFAGERQADRFKLNLITTIEYDTQTTQETWAIAPDRLTTPDQTYTAIPCPATSDPPIPVQIVRMEFPPGANSTVIQQSVVRGSRTIYLVNAKEGQRFTLRIVALENNAVVDILAPGGKAIQQEVTQADLPLPATGNFQVVVGSTRGNATYRLEVKIE